MVPAGRAAKDTNAFHLHHLRTPAPRTLYADRRYADRGLGARCWLDRYPLDRYRLDRYRGANRYGMLARMTIRSQNLNLKDGQTEVRRPVRFLRVRW